MEQYLIFLPGFIYVILGIAHYMNYRKRRFFVNKWIQDDRIHQVYFYYLYKENDKNQGTKHNEHEINMLLNRIAGHNWLSYWAAFVITFIMVTIFSYITMTGFEILEPSIFCGILDINCTFFEFISGMKQPIYFAALGALIWGFYEFLQRYRNQNWSAVAQHMIWFKIPISMIICNFIFNESDSEVASIVAFGIGAFPIDFLRKFVMNATSTKLGGQNKNMLSSPRWESIKGITDQVIEKFEEYGVENVHQLASADPFRLHFNTNIEFVTILDFIDQALLISFINPEIVKILQQNGVTGAIDIAFIHEKEAEKTDLIDSLAVLSGYNKIKGTEANLKDFILFDGIMSNITEDPRVKLIKGLWDLNIVENNHSRH